MISNIFFWLQTIAAVLIIVFVVFQPSKGSDLGSIAGGSTSNAGKTHVDMPTKITGFILLSYMIFSFLISWYSAHYESPQVIEQVLDTNYLLDDSINNEMPVENEKTIINKNGEE